MAFDWKRFAASFIEGAAQNIERRGEDARTYKEEQKEAAKRNAEVIRTRAAKAKQAATYARKAKMYLDSHPDADMMVKAAMSAGPAEIQTLYEKLEAAANQPGQNGKLGEADVDTLINMPELPGVDKQYIDMGLEEFAMQTYGASKDSIIRSAEEQEEVGIIGQLFGVGSKQRVDEQLRKEQYGMGMSISDINDLAEQSEYQNIIKDASLTYGTLDRFVVDDYIKFDAVLTKAMKDALDANENILKGVADTEEKLAKKKKIQQSAVDGLIKASVEQDVNLLKSVPATQRIAAIMGQDYLDKLYIDNGIFTEDKLKEMRGEAGKDGRTTDAEAAAAKEAAATKAAAAKAPAASATPDTAKVTPRPEANVDPLDINAPINSDAQQEWDRKYYGKYDPITGDPIVVPKRPAKSENREERKPGGRINYVSLYNEWNKKYGDTHDPETGLPLPVEE